MSAPVLLHVLAELDAELRATADVITGEHSLDSENDHEDTEEAPPALPSRRRRALELVEHEH